VQDRGIRDGRLSVREPAHLVKETSNGSAAIRTLFDELAGLKNAAQSNR
jgi:hypothetical protein